MKVSFLDVGQGDGAYLEFPDGKNALIDGGPDRKVLEGLGKKMPFYSRKIDIIFLSHPHADHVAGLVHVLDRYEVGRVVLTRAVHTTPEYQEFLKLVKAKNIPVTEAIRGTEFDFSGDSKIRVLYPTTSLDGENLNSTSEVLLLSVGKTKFLFMGDLEKDGSDQMVQIENDLKADIVKVPHHGSSNALNENLYRKVNPKYAVIEVGKDNKYGHPHSALVQFLDSAGIKYFRTDKDGSVEFVSDGTNVFLKKESNIFAF